MSLNVFLVSKQLALLSSEITVFSDSPVKYTYFNLTPCNVICSFTVTDLCTSLTEYLDHQSHENQQRNGSSAIASRRCDILFVSIYNYPDILYNNILLFPEVMYLGTCKMLVLENSWQALSSGFGIPHLGAWSKNKHWFESRINSNFLKVFFIVLDLTNLEFHIS